MPWYASGGGSGGTTNAQLDVTGSVANSGGLPAPGAAGTAYITRDTGHIWVSDGSTFVDAGNVTGPAGPAPILLTGTTTSLPSGSAPTADVVAVSTGKYRIDIGLPGIGTSFKQSFSYTQASAVVTWTFTHDLDFEPAGVRITDDDNPDVEWSVDVDYDAASKTFTLTFPVAVRGTVTVS